MFDDLIDAVIQGVPGASTNLLNHLRTNAPERVVTLVTRRLARYAALQLALSTYHDQHVLTVHDAINRAAAAASSHGLAITGASFAYGLTPASRRFLATMRPYLRAIAAHYLNT